MDDLPWPALLVPIAAIAAGACRPGSGSRVRTGLPSKLAMWISEIRETIAGKSTDAYQGADWNALWTIAGRDAEGNASKVRFDYAIGALEEDYDLEEDQRKFGEAIAAGVSGSWMTTGDFGWWRGRALMRGDVEGTSLTSSNSDTFYRYGVKGAAKTWPEVYAKLGVPVRLTVTARYDEDRPAIHYNTTFTTKLS